ARRAEEVRGHARAHDEVVVTDPEVVEQPDLLRLVVRLDQVLVHHVQVLLLEPQAAQEVGDVPRVQAAGSHLVQQRLERVVDPPVDARYPHGRVAQRLDHGHPCEPTTLHDHVRQRLGRPGQGRLEAVLEVVRGLRVGRGMRWIRHRHESPPDRRRSHPLRLRAAPGLPWSVVSTSDTTGRALANGLRTRHLTMMGLGSAIGAGLFLGSGLGVAAAGPAVLLSYAIAGAIVVLVMRMLAEMAAALPSSGSFSVYAETALGRWAGFLLGWLYWFTIVMVLGVEVTGVAGIVHGWWPAVPQWGVAAVVVAVFGAINLVGVRQFGEAEFWFAAIKVAAIVGFLVLGVLVVVGVVPVTGSILGDWAAHGGFAPAGLPGIAAGLLTVVFAFGGIEIVTIAAAEAREPQKAVTAATRTILWRILFFYVGSVAIMVALIPWTDTARLESPFVAVLEMAGFDGAARLMEVVVVLALLSAFNANVYATSRMLFSLGGR